MGVERVPLPVLQGPGEALVRVRLAGLCGSDMHPYCGRETGLDMGTIMGHEFVGIVEKVGLIPVLDPGDCNGLRVCHGLVWLVREVGVSRTCPLEILC